ncbi:uncharacterized protein KY384_003811 [Bacidia gigantensis]|uniref:uncharacterized protein n=1 Tax=Bacidia gigantensis TaxID=2732470 RepID=UPI001D0597A3|nr:uncharacterized protein KY384_003811 [Bacidia gigantensis]KAG8532171.1 hypothetical protein KY384_003811 [Bacidia gigantensis]
MAKDQQCTKARRPSKSHDRADKRVSKPRNQHASQMRRPSDEATNSSNSELASIPIKTNGQTYRVSFALPEHGESPSAIPLLKVSLERRLHGLAGGRRSAPNESYLPTRRHALEHSTSLEWQNLKEESVESGDINDPVDESDDEFPLLDDKYEPVPVKAQDINIDLYKDMFRMLKQNGCKKLVQAWLRKCHRKKQGNYPYNGGINWQRFADWDPNNRGKHSAPPYWPDQVNYEDPNSNSCRHKEPDHQRKHETIVNDSFTERLNLLCHLLRVGTTYVDYNFSIDKLQEGTKDTVNQHKDHFPPRAAEILEDIYRARMKEEEFLRGEVDGDNTIWLLLALPPKSSRNAAWLLQKNSRPRKEPRRGSSPNKGPRSPLSGNDSSSNLCYARSERDESIETDSDVERVDAGHVDQATEKDLPVLVTTTASTVPEFRTSTIPGVSSKRGYPWLPSNRNSGNKTSHSSSQQDIQRKASSCTSISQKSALSSAGSSIVSEPMLTTGLSDMMAMPRELSSQSTSGYLSDNVSSSSSERMFPSNVWNPHHAGEQLITTTIRPKFKSSASTSSSFALDAPVAHIGDHNNLFNFTTQPLHRDQCQHSGSSDIDVAGSNYSTALPWGVNVYTTNDKSYTVDEGWYNTIYDDQNCLPNNNMCGISANTSLQSNFESVSNQLQNPPLNLDIPNASMQTSFGSNL